MIRLGLDDFSERVNNLDLLWRLHDYFDNFKVSLFTIPDRTTRRFISYINQLNWIDICLHGDKHEHFELISRDRLYQLSKQGYSKIYRPPYFELSDEMKKNLDDEEFYVPPAPNWNIKDEPTKADDVHAFGHIYPHDYLSEKGNKGDSLFRFYKNIMLLPKDTKFGFYENYRTT